MPVTVIHNPENHLPRIDCIWMVLSVDDRGSEGVVATPAEGVGSMPLVVADPKLVPMIEKIARNLARFTGKEMRLVKFSNREVIKDLGRKH